MLSVLLGGTWKAVMFTLLCLYLIVENISIHFHSINQYFFFPLYQLISAKPGTHSDLRKPSAQLINSSILLCQGLRAVERQKRPARSAGVPEQPQHGHVNVEAPTHSWLQLLHSTPSPKHLKEAEHARTAFISPCEFSHRLKAEPAPALRGDLATNTCCARSSA